MFGSRLGKGHMIMMRRFKSFSDMALYNMPSV